MTSLAPPPSYFLPPSFPPLLKLNDFMYLIFAAYMAVNGGACTFPVKHPAATTSSRKTNVHWWKYSRRKHKPPNSCAGLGERIWTKNRTTSTVLRSSKRHCTNNVNRKTANIRQFSIGPRMDPHHPPFIMEHWTNITWGGKSKCNEARIFHLFLIHFHIKFQPSLPCLIIFLMHNQKFQIKRSKIYYSYFITHQLSQQSQ